MVCLIVLFFLLLAGVSYKKELQWKHDPINKLLLWTCYDECGYDCMWRTTAAFHNRNWTTPQFYGKVAASISTL